MLSHLRFHRRGHSSNSASASPSTEQPSQWDTSDHPPARGPSPRPASPPRLTIPIPSQPPTLPPIARVASPDTEHLFSPLDDPTLAPPPAPTSPPPPPPPVSAPPLAPVASVASAPAVSAPAPTPQHESHPPAARSDPDGAGFIGGAALQNLRRASQDPASRDSAVPESRLLRSKPPPPPINTSLHKPKSSWFSTPVELQGGGSSKKSSTSRLGAEGAPPPERKKGLPFLKNPVSSLLSRRKAAHASLEVQPTPAYDPSIRGTRVHDFSAPRPKKQPVPVAVIDSPAKIVENVSKPQAPANTGEPSQPRPNDIPSISPAGLPEAAAATPDPQVNENTQTSEPKRPSSIQPDGPVDSLHASSSAASSDTLVGPLPQTSSMRSTASRQLSRVSRQDSVASALPKHMKSTSSRFSFDMIGAAKQEKLLEERHRQRQQEKKEPPPPPVDQDPRFAELEDEDFDYDAMMDDDGLEEKIPGINADYDDDFEDQFDPDNDQENFAGFVFQRSNPVSNLNSPLPPAVAMATPRDANGQVIGFAVTKDATPDPSAPVSPMPPGSTAQQPAAPTNDSGVADAQQQNIPPSSGPPPATATTTGQAKSTQAFDNDDIYFDDGLADELDFQSNDPPFDESLFDLDDTDQFGRPIPGAFAMAKERLLKQAAQQKSNRDSDLTSSTSGQSGPAQSTGQTSFNIGPQVPEHPEKPPEPKPGMGIPSQELAYQAALAEAAQKAAASGKFRRDSSSESLSEQGDGAAGETVDRSYLDDYDDDRFNNDFDDFDFDDEAIIAEANASALANDADGFYGQEFGFYSAPPPQPSASSSRNYNEGLFQYANGGYFGPANAGLMRSASGRVCREPNLTPITERSEYSNRNSIMSFTLPPPLGSAGGAGSERNSASLASPGLAQLALLPDDPDNMSLSALMKLRSKAWGGSQASLVSSREGSPRSERATIPDAGASSPYAAVPSHLAGHVRVNSGLSVWSSSDVADDVGGNGASAAAGNGNGTTPAAALQLAMMAAASSTGPRPGSAGGSGLAASPLPQQPLPQSMFMVPQSSMAQGQIQQQQKQPLVGSACSPVLEGEENEEGFQVPSPKPPLEAALPLRAKEGGK